MARQTRQVAHNVAHFAVHADDVSRARRFYERVFGWKFEPWGPPDFFLITTGPKDDPGIHGALQKRSEALSEVGMRGFECTISVGDLDAIAKAITSHGGKITLPRMELPTVGSLVQFLDTEGNVVNAMQYEATVQK